MPKLTGRCLSICQYFYAFRNCRYTLVGSVADVVMNSTVPSTQDYYEVHFHQFLFIVPFCAIGNFHENSKTSITARLLLDMDT